MILHTLSCSVVNGALGDCLRLCATGDTVLCLDDSIYGLRDTETNNKQLRLVSGISFKVLESDLALRGLDKDSLLPEVEVCDDKALIVLSEAATKVIHWG